MDCLSVRRRVFYGYVDSNHSPVLRLIILLTTISLHIHNKQDRKLRIFYYSPRRYFYTASKGIMEKFFLFEYKIDSYFIEKFAFRSRNLL